MLPIDGSKDAGTLICCGWLFVGGLVFCWIAFRTRPELEINQDSLFIRGVEIPRQHIEYCYVTETPIGQGIGTFVAVRLNGHIDCPRHWRWYTKLVLRRVFENIHEQFGVNSQPDLVVQLNRLDIDVRQFNIQ